MSEVTIGNERSSGSIGAVGAVFFVFIEALLFIGLSLDIFDAVCMVEFEATVGSGGGDTGS